MVVSKRPPVNAFVRRARKIYNPIGFVKGYNFVLFFIFAGAMMGFVPARIEYLNFYGVFCGPGASPVSHAAPGECYYYLGPSHGGAGIIMHLGTIISVVILVCFQFVPGIRHKAILAYRINGYVILVFSLVSTAGVFMLLRHAFGGTLATQYNMRYLAVVFLGSLVMAYINVKRLQVEEHRAWMLRARFYAGSIITLRIIMGISATIVSRIGGYYTAEPCDKLASIVGSQDRTMARYPGCDAYFSGSNPDQHVAVLANINGSTAEQAAAALIINFGPAGWLSLALHAIGVEIYLHLIPAETERLHKVSYQRQLEAGMKNPGKAGLTAGRLGDVEEWTPRDEER